MQREDRVSPDSTPQGVPSPLLKLFSILMEIHSPLPHPSLPSYSTSKRCSPSDQVDPPPEESRFLKEFPPLPPISQPSSHPPTALSVPHCKPSSPDGGADMAQDGQGGVLQAHLPSKLASSSAMEKVVATGLGLDTSPSLCWVEKKLGRVRFRQSR
ncbi:hypothetical protein NE237_016731 [Protea cynaroides]|uniref:Uncharacterized protein n=1 Tax=Protea cynaroides TaxID=273540 RepID=A0A9Q0HED4_9MAGN|nr:hypothetical protein NE237_016731 [Protea cynaroides]